MAPDEVLCGWGRALPVARKELSRAPEKYLRAPTPPPLLRPARPSKGVSRGRILHGNFGTLKVRFGQFQQFSDLLLVTVGFYGSESVPKVVSIRLSTFSGLVLGRVAQKCEVFFCRFARFGWFFCFKLA